MSAQIDDQFNEYFASIFNKIDERIAIVHVKGQIRFCCQNDLNKFRCIRKSVWKMLVSIDKPKKTKQKKFGEQLRFRKFFMIIDLIQIEVSEKFDELIEIRAIHSTKKHGNILFRNSL